MKTSFFFFFTLLVLITLGKCYYSEAQENSLLWKISGNGLQQESYLFGTIHLICEDDFWMDEAVSIALNQSKQVLMELDLDDPAMMAQMQQLSMRPGMKNISENLSEEDKKVLDDYFKTNYGAGMDQLGILKPFTLSTMALMKSLPCEKTKSYEEYFKNSATTSNKEILGLESVADQMSIFDQIPEKTQISELVKMIQEGSGDEEFAELVTLYRSQNLSKMLEFMTDDWLFADFKEIMLDQRNQKWIPLIEEKIAQTPTFIAVGSGHLPGDQGVISLLRKQGYQVTPIQ